MRRVAVISGAFTNEDWRWYCLRESAIRFNIRLHMLGLGLTYPNPDVLGYKILADYLKDVEADYVLLTDSYDTMVVRWDPGEVVAAVDAARGRLLVAANDDPWPPGPWIDSYPFTGTPWRTANGGQMAGTKESILWICEQFVRWQWYGESSLGGNQKMLHMMKVADAPFSVDTECSIFQTLRAPSRPWVCLRDGVTVNRLTKTKPMFLHFAGGQPGLVDWFRRLYGIDDRHYELVRGRRPVIEVPECSKK